MLTVFLSHSSKDKAFVRRVNQDLKSHKFETWIDEEKISFGDSIPDGINKGLKESNILLLFLSKSAVLSAWVKEEWMSAFHNQVNKNNVVVIPVLIEVCDIPEFLQNRRYVDFRELEKYEENLSELLRFLHEKSREFDDFNLAGRGKSFSSIEDHTRDLLDDLSTEYIALPENRRMPLIATLKKMPRSGKLIRIESFHRKKVVKTKLKARTIYSHIITLSHIADNLLPHFDHGLKAEEFGDLARCFAYHELNEVLLGDIPTFTNLNRRRRTAAKVYAEERLRTVDPAERKGIADKFLWMFLSEKHRTSFSSVNEIIHEREGSIYRVFKMIDKIDPILSVWRYLHQYRGQLGETPKVFNSEMKDFYENPDVPNFVRRNIDDVKIYDLVNKLRNRTYSWDYYCNPDKIFGDPQMFSIPTHVVRNLIEGIDLFVE